MKNRFLLLMLVAATLIGCQQKEDAIVPQNINILQKSYAIDFNQGTLDVYFQADCEYSVNIQNADWLSLIKTTVVDQSLCSSFTYTQNTQSEQRCATITFISENGLVHQSVQVTQTAFNEQLPTITIPKKEYHVDHTEGFIEVFIQTDTALIVNIEDPAWVTQVLTKSESLKYYKFSYSKNETLASRSTNIIFTSTNGLVSDAINIQQLSSIDVMPTINSFVFEVKNNPTQLISNIVGQINEDGSILAHIPYIIQSKKLIPTINYVGKTISEIESPDFSDQIVYTVENESGVRKNYTVLVTANTGIPMIFISTKDNKPITSKDVYVEGSVKLDGNGKVPSMEAPMKIKGRGNTTWALPKKPYKIKFDKKQSMAGFPADKEWVLLANYLDQTLIRNAVAFEIGNIIGMDWSNRGCLVDVYLNNKYQGNYLLCEQIKIAKDRVNIVELEDSDVSEDLISGGYLLELDATYDEVQKFRSKTRNLPVMIKEPDLNSTQFTWIENHFNKVEECIYSENFADPINGYSKYIDVNSFINWWLVYELMGNWEPNHPKSSYMSKDRGGKFKMGPIWDFDYATCVNPSGFYIKESIWYDALFKDPSFVSLVKKRWNDTKPQLMNLQTFINEKSVELEYSQKKNYQLWGTPSLDPSGVMLGSYLNEIQNMKGYFENRIVWLDREINAL